MRGVVHAATEVDIPTVRGQVARVLSLDHDANGFVDIGRRDPVIGRLQAVAPGLRPPLFYSPYEAAAWVVMSARRSRPQVAAVRRRLSETYGTVFHLAGQPLAALPTPERLLTIDSFPGLTADKMDRLRGVARAALAGTLESDRLKALGPGPAKSELRSLKGIGPFYSELIAIRACGFTDLLPSNEPRVLDRVRRLSTFATPRHRPSSRRWQRPGGRSAPGPRSSSGQPPTGYPSLDDAPASVVFLGWGQITRQGCR